LFCCFCSFLLFSTLFLLFLAVSALSVSSGEEGGLCAEVSTLLPREAQEVSAQRSLLSPKEERKSMRRGISSSLRKSPGTSAQRYLLLL